ncbi:hypothetical protein ACUIJQ_12650 [Levilactobacillus hammesii]|nr:hypothetical protein [Levilactobacillus hammesii]
MMSEWAAIQETLFLMHDGLLVDALEREAKDEAETAVKTAQNTK